MIKELFKKHFNIIVILILVFLIIDRIRLSYNMEKMTDTTESGIREAVKNVYQIDVQAIKNLGDLAKQIKDANGTLTIPANLNVTGDITTSGNLFLTDKNKHIETYKLKFPHNQNGKGTFESNAAALFYASPINGWSGLKIKTINDNKTQYIDKIHLGSDVNNFVEPTTFSKKVTCNDELQINNGGENVWGTHFNHQNKGETYIRGVFINLDKKNNKDGVININGNLKIPNIEATNIKIKAGKLSVVNDQDHLRAVIDGNVVTDGKTLHIENNRVGNQAIGLYANGSIKATGEINTSANIKATGEIKTIGGWIYRGNVRY